MSGKLIIHHDFWHCRCTVLRLLYVKELAAFHASDLSAASRIHLHQYLGLDPSYSADDMSTKACKYCLWLALLMHNATLSQRLVCSETNTLLREDDPLCLEFVSLTYARRPTATSSFT